MRLESPQYWRSVARQTPSRTGWPVSGMEPSAGVQENCSACLGLTGATLSQGSCGEAMGTGPFIKSPFARHSGTNRRRSTRIDFSVPIVLSGRDAKGETFRESTRTAIVNLHGARLITSREILVGMQVSIDNPQNGASEKAVCVRIEGAAPGENAHYIAVQLVRPGNIWGVPAPPADWEVVAANTLGYGYRSQSVTSAPPAAAPSPEVSIPVVESQAITWEQQSAELVECALQIFRRQIEVLLNAALKEFEGRLEVLEKDAENRMELRSGKALTEVSNLIQGMREEIAGQIAAHGNLVVDAAERDLRAKVAEILSPIVGVTASLHPAKPATTLPRK
jgi:hypothetical protein